MAFLALGLAVDEQSQKSTTQCSDKTSTHMDGSVDIQTFSSYRHILV